MCNGKHGTPFNQGIEDATPLGFLPISRQCRTLAAAAASKIGDQDLAGSYLAAARDDVDELTNRFQDADLKAAYTEHTHRTPRLEKN